MKTEPVKVPATSPPTPVENAVRRSNEKELRRILGRDLIEAERKKTRR